MIKVGKVSFEWDEEKNSQNRKKHNVDFSEAVSIFLNTPIKIFFDPDHSENEDRYIAIGISIKSRVLVVVHCESVDGIVVRLISARKATKSEQRLLSGDKK